MVDEMAASRHWAYIAATGGSQPKDPPGGAPTFGYADRLNESWPAARVSSLRLERPGARGGVGLYVPRFSRRSEQRGREQHGRYQ
jgi:hypothetical protein